MVGGVGSDREQELARTMTAPGRPASPTTESIGATLGRFRLERELGAGAMGVVHAAFDPDLERRIALKVLRGAATREAKDRLMREARAMARLSHPNVVTVHEVGTAGGRDFVAMELIHGEPLADWVRSARRPATAILDAFAAAGRGLAAAHAAGIVHRDFKPHNVLRSRGGRIVVTDFGLAREAHIAPAVPPTPALDTPPSPAAATAGSSQSPLAGLTVTGSLLGTPAYMAPEQWHGGAVTPATDQFAFCVALWEALSGKRPYPGPTFDDLRTQVARGPAALDASGIPRRVRGILRRGLDPDPPRRWPTMEALLAQLEPLLDAQTQHRKQRRIGVGLASIGAGVVGAVALLVKPPPPPPVAECDPPAAGVAAVWSPALRSALGAQTSDAHVALFDTAYWDWRAARGAACAAAPQIRQAQLQCLDGVLARFDALRQAALRVPGVPAEEFGAQLVDPAVCRKPTVTEVPRLALAPTAGVVAAYALYGRAQTEHKPSDAELVAAIDAPAAEPCTRVIASLAFDTASSDAPRARTLVADAIAAADQCGDERLRAELLIRNIEYRWERPMVGRNGVAAIHQAEIAAARVLQSDLAAQLDEKKLVVATQHERWPEVFRLADATVDGYRARSLPLRVLRAVVERNRLRLLRCEPGGLDALAADVRAWRPRAVALHEAELTRLLDIEDGIARFLRGDVAAAHADLVRLWQAQAKPPDPRHVHAVTGVVVDAAGRPVAGARIAAGRWLTADSIGFVPRLDASGYLRDDALRFATSDDDGRFEIEAAAGRGSIAAEAGTRRSQAQGIADHARLVLEPTRRITGRVDLAGVPASRVTVHAMVPGTGEGLVQIVAPVAPDGTFALDGAPLRGFGLGAMIFGNGEFNENIQLRDIRAGTSPLTNVALDLGLSDRTVDVGIRSAATTQLEGAEVVLFGGRPQIATLADLQRFRGLGMQFHMAQHADGGELPAELAGKLGRDDLWAHIENAAPGELTVCAFGFAGDLVDPEYWSRLQAHRSEVALTCQRIDAATSAVVLAVPVQRRLE